MSTITRLKPINHKPIRTPCLSVMNDKKMPRNNKIYRTILFGLMDCLRPLIKNSIQREVQNAMTVLPHLKYTFCITSICVEKGKSIASTKQDLRENPLSNSLVMK